LQSIILLTRPFLAILVSTLFLTGAPIALLIVLAIRIVAARLLTTRSVLLLLFTLTTLPILVLLLLAILFPAPI